MKLIAKSLLSAAVGAAVLAAVPTLGQAKELRILAWEGYADPDWVKEFEEQTGADVNVVFIGTDDEIWAKIKGSEGKDFDLFAVNTAQLQRYLDLGLVEPYDLDKVPNQKETLPRFQDLTKVTGVMRDGKVYAIPYAFDSIGLIYDTDKVKTPPDSWKVLWDPQYAGQGARLRQRRAQFHHHRADHGHRGSLPPDRRAARRGRGEADRPQAQRAQLLHHRRRGAAALPAQRRRPHLRQLRPAAGQGDAGCRRARSPTSTRRKAPPPGSTPGR